MTAAIARQPSMHHPEGVALASVTALNNAARAIEALADIVLASAKPVDVPASHAPAPSPQVQAPAPAAPPPADDIRREVVYSALHVAERQTAELDMLLADVQACLRELTPRLKGESAARVMGLRTRIVDFNNGRKRREVAR